AGDWSFTPGTPLVAGAHVITAAAVDLAGNHSPSTSLSMTVETAASAPSLDLEIQFGAYVQAYQENSPKNTNNPQTIDAIYLCPTNNTQGGHENMYLNSGRVITRPRVWEIPVTPVVIRAVETMAEEQGIKSLKLQNRRKTTLYLADWIAGVDYNNKNNDHDDEDDTEYENEENNNAEYEDDDAIEDEENFDRVNQQEIDEILADTTKKEEANPTDMEDYEAQN
ncbi:MAG: Ig-like domain-containing protein, partial [Candidatus Baltobacteraceae bacterium]